MNVQEVGKGLVEVPKVFDGKGNLITPQKRYRVNTASPKGIRLEQHRLYKAWLRGEIESIDMWRGINALRTMLDAVLAEELARDVAELKAQRALP